MDLNPALWALLSHLSPKAPGVCNAQTENQVDYATQGYDDGQLDSLRVRGNKHLDVACRTVPITPCAQIQRLPIPEADDMIQPQISLVRFRTNIQ
jgi:hypothetical protein